MKKAKLGSSILLACAFVLGTLASASAQSLELKLTGCLTNKGKLKRVEIGTEPVKDCKSNQTEVMIPLTAKTDLLMDVDAAQGEEIDTNADKGSANMDAIGDNTTAIDINTKKTIANMEDIGDNTTAIDINTKKTIANMEDIGDNTTAIDDNASLIGENTLYIDEVADKAYDNMEAIQDLADNGISSIIGGSVDEYCCGGTAEIFTPLYEGDRYKEENYAHSKMAAQGSVTRIVVHTAGNPRAGGSFANEVNYTLRKNGEDTDLSCTVLGSTDFEADGMCEVEGCAQYSVGDKIDLLSQGEQISDVPVNSPLARWTARFVENGTCPPPPLVPWCDTVMCEDPTPDRVSCTNGDPIDQEGVLLCTNLALEPA